MEKLLAAVAQTHGFDDDEPVFSTPVENFVSRGENGGSRRFGEGSGDGRPSEVVEKVVQAPTLVTPPVGRVIGGGEKRRRGRPPKGQSTASAPPPKRKKVEKDEDVCFICFDGGDLILCDFKGCPKAYHPACVKREPSFFNTKSKWYCGWHICRTCEKASHFMCYTCTYALCKGCIREGDFMCVRENKGFCPACMKLAKLCETKDQATIELAQVDFNDTTCFEYFFKAYWQNLKVDLSLTINDLIQAKDPFKAIAVGGEVSNSNKSTKHLELNKSHLDSNLTHNVGLRTSLPRRCHHVESLGNGKGEATKESCIKEATKKSCIEEATKVSCIEEATKVSCIVETTKVSCIKEATKESCIQENQDDSAVQDSNKPLICESTRERESENSGIDSNQWASKDLLKFVSHMKNGDTSPIPQFDVQNLLLDYIKRNNLRDPRQKSQIICDPMLKKLFGKPRVGHIEMLKLPELHFLRKEDSQPKSLIPAGFIVSAVSDAEVEGKSTDVLPTPIKHKKRKSLRNARKDPRDEYAAIDIHNINLVYLRRNLMENLIDDHDNFNDKVIGSFVRIRVPTNDQTPEIFRLVKVAGTRKVAESYKVGDKTTDVMLEVLNLNNIEVVSIDAISNFEFTEDECRSLRESIRCGLIEGITVGDIQRKAMKLQSVRVNDWLETEILRLNHLQNRASEKGHDKELREYADRLELLKSPEERQRRISEVPEINTDPKMNPLYKSDDNTRNGENGEIDGHVGPSYSSYPRNRRKSIALDKKGKDDRLTKSRKRTREKADPSGSKCLDKQMNQINIDHPAARDRMKEKADPSGSNGLDKHMNQTNIDLPAAGDRIKEKAGPSGSNGLDEHMNQINIDRPAAGDRIKEKADPSGSNGLDKHMNQTNIDRPAAGDRIKEKAGPSGSNVLDKHMNQINIDRPAAGDRIKEKADPSGSNGLDKHMNQINIDCPSAGDRNDQMSGLETSTAIPPTGNSPSADHIEIEKLWHYRDPNGRIQGPFSVMQLRIWSSTGLFPLDMRIWTNHELFDSLLLSDALNGKLHGASDLLDKPPSGSNEATGEIVVPEATNGEGTDHKQTEGLCGDSTSVPSDKNTEHVTADEPGSSGWPQCWDLLKDGNSSADDVQNCNLPPPLSSGKEDVSLTSDEVNYGSQNGEKHSTGLTQNPMTSEQEPSEEKMSSINIDLSSNDLVLDSSKWDEKIKELDFPSPTPTAENQQTILAVEDVPIQDSGILELLSPAPSLQKEYQEGQPTETKQPGFTMFPSPMPGWSCDSTLGIGPLQLPEVVDPWCGYSPTPARSEWESDPKPAEVVSEGIDTSVSETQHPTSQAAQTWLELMNEPIEFDALGEESVSDLLAEVDAMESRGSFPSPTSALKFAREFLEDCNTDCFSSIEDFSSTPAQPMKSDAFSSTTDVQLTSQSSAPCKPMGSSASSEGETNAPGHSGDAASEFHPHAPQNTGEEMVGTGPGPILDATDPGWGTVQGNINLVTVQGNVNLVLVGGPGQGMGNIGWGSNPGPAWTNPSTSRSPRNASLPWDGQQQRKYSAERFSSPREWGGGYQGGGDSGFGRGRPPWGRQPYGGSGGGGSGGSGGGGGGYSRPLPRGQRVCKFYESGHCKKGAFCDYLHP